MGTTRGSRSAAPFPIRHTHTKRTIHCGHWLDIPLTTVATYPPRFRRSQPYEGIRANTFKPVQKRTRCVNLA